MEPIRGGRQDRDHRQPRPRLVSICYELLDEQEGFHRPRSAVDVLKDGFGISQAGRGALRRDFVDAF
jgi:hypothetical protein